MHVCGQLQRERGLQRHVDFLFERRGGLRSVAKLQRYLDVRGELPGVEYVVWRWQRMYVRRSLQRVGRLRGYERHLYERQRHVRDAALVQRHGDVHGDLPWAGDELR